MKIPLSHIPVGGCFLQGKKIRKKVGDDRVASFGLGGRVKTRKTTANPDVEQASCPLRFLAVGLRRHPDVIVEIGDGDILKRERKGRKS